MTQHEARENWVKLCKQYQERLDSFPRKNGADGEELRDIPATELESLEKMRADITDAKAIVDKFSKVTELEQDYLQANKAEQSEDFLDKSIRDLIEKGKKFEWDVLDKTTMTTGAGFAPQAIRTGEVVPAIHRPVQFWNRINVIPTDQSSVVFMEQTTRTVNAGEIAEAGDLDTANESAFAYTERTEPVRRIGHIIPIAREQLEDVNEARSLVTNDMIQGLIQKMELQWLRGDGNSPNLSGILDTSNRTRVQTKAKSTLDYSEVFADAISQVEIQGRANADLIIVPGSVYWAVAKERTSDGVYIFGSPQERANFTFWGVEVARSEAFANTTVGSADGVVFDRSMVRARIRRQVEISMTDTHDDNFAKDVMAIRAQARVAVQVLRPEAIVKMTGL